MGPEYDVLYDRCLRAEIEIASLKTECKRLRVENEQLRSGGLVLGCLWCGVVLPKSTDIVKDIQAAKDHAQGCDRNPVKRERDRHIKAVANKELDWFAEKRRADLLEAKCVEMAEALKKLGRQNQSGQHCIIVEALKDNPSQLLLERLKGTEECRDHYMNLLAEEVKLSNSLQERLEKLRRAVEAVPPAWAGYKDWREGVDKPLAACEPKERG